MVQGHKYTPSRLAPSSYITSLSTNVPYSHPNLKPRAKFLKKVPSQIQMKDFAFPAHLKWTTKACTRAIFTLKADTTDKQQVLLPNTIRKCTAYVKLLLNYSDISL